MDVVSHFAGVNVDPSGLGEGQEGAEAEQVDRGDEGEHGGPGARGLDEVPREIHHQDACTQQHTVRVNTRNLWES